MPTWWTTIVVTWIVTACGFMTSCTLQVSTVELKAPNHSTSGAFIEEPSKNSWRTTEKRRVAHSDVPAASAEVYRHWLPMTDTISDEPPVIAKPYFEATWPRNVSVILGHTAVLKCRVRLLGDRMVSWIRKRDLHVLTSAVVSYTSDGRFNVRHNRASDDWELLISSTQARDAGFYECQVNTEPKLHWPIYLQVYSARAVISGPSEVHVRRGSTLSVTCTLKAPLSPESALVWYQDGRLIQLEKARSIISLATERSENFLSSRLLLPRASVDDGGNYTCVPTEALPVSVFVHVLNGEHPAAMQHANRSSGSCLRKAVSVLFVLAFTWWTWHWLALAR